MEGLDLERLKARSREIREALAKVRQYAALPDAEFWADERNMYTVMHLLLQAIEGVAGLCMHILAKTARAAPASYAECFAGLQKLGLLDDDLAGWCGWPASATSWCIATETWTRSVCCAMPERT